MPEVSDRPAGSTAEVRAQARRLRGAGRLEEAARALRAAAGPAEVHNDLAVVLRELGRPEEAEAHFRRAVALAPGFAPYHANLGQTLMMRGRADEAVEAFRRAVALAPGHAAFWRVLGDALESLGRLDGAEPAYREAARRAAGSAEAHHDLGSVLVALGRLDEALAPLERAAALDPGNPAHWENLAARHERAGQFGPAIGAWERALARGAGDRAYPHLALGRALKAEGRADEAEARFRAASALEPGSADARIELGALAEERGDFEPAEAAYREAVAVDPASPWGHVRLAWLLRGRLPDADLADLERRLDDPSCGPEPRLRLLYAATTVHDARGQIPRAAALGREANALQSRLDRAAGRGFDPDDHARWIDGLIAGFGPAFFARTAGAGRDTPRPVFVVGLPRSGTTLIEQVLASHPDVHGAGELDLARAAFAALPGLAGRPDESPSACAARLDPGSIGRLADDYGARLDGLDGGRSARVVDKMPDNAQYLGLLAALFPRATFLHCRRDLRDTALSCWLTVFEGLPWTNDPAHIAAKFRGHLRLMDHWRSALPATIHEVDYEEAVSDLEGVARRLVAALGLGWHPACLEFHRAGRSVRTASAIQVRQPVHSRSVGRWRAYESELSDLFAALPGGG